MSLFDDPSRDCASDLELATIDAAFERLLTDWHQASAELSRATDAKACELQIYRLQRANTHARSKVVNLLKAIDRTALHIDQPNNKETTAEDTADVTHAPRTFGGVSG